MLITVSISRVDAAARCVFIVSDFFLTANTDRDTQQKKWNLKSFLTKRRLKIQNKHQRREEHFQPTLIRAFLFSESSRDYILFDLSVFVLLFARSLVLMSKKYVFGSIEEKLINVCLSLSFRSDSAGAFREADKAGLKIKEHRRWKPHRVDIHLLSMTRLLLNLDRKLRVKWFKEW